MEFEEINDPKSWEKYFKSLLKYRFGQEKVFDIPDKNQGDWGVECYTECGIIYQCYFPEERYSVSQLYEKQRYKINDDLNKLVKDNVQIWQGVFNNLGIKVKHWVLATPSFTNKLLAQYITKKTKEVRALGLDFLDADFTVCVHTADDYPVQQQALASCFKHIKIEVDEISDSELAEWMSAQVGFLADLHPKLEKLANGSEDKLSEQKFAISNYYLTYQNMLDVLEKDYPLFHIKIIDCANTRKKELKRRIALLHVDKAPSELLAKHIELLEKDLAEIMPNFLNSNRTDVCMGIIAGWLIECPLRF